MSHVEANLPRIGVTSEACPEKKTRQFTCPGRLDAGIPPLARYSRGKHVGRARLPDIAFLMPIKDEDTLDTSPHVFPFDAFVRPLVTPPSVVLLTPFVLESLGIVSTCTS